MKYVYSTMAAGGFLIAIGMLFNSYHQNAILVLIFSAVSMTAAEVVELSEKLTAKTELK